MKNLFLALAFLFVGSIGYANSEINIKNYNENYDVELDTYSETFLVFNLKGAVLCWVTATKSFTTDYGVTHTQTISYLQWALDESHCSLINMITQYLYENSSGI